MGGFYDSKGSGGGGGFYSGSVSGSGGSSGASKKSKKPKQKKGLGALLQGLEDMVKGFGPGMAHLGVSAYNDVDRTLGDVLPGRKSKSYMLDDVGKAIGADYKKRYAPLFKGDFMDFLGEVNERPLDFILDAATIATLGGGGVTLGARGVLAGAKGGMAAGSASAKLAKIGGYVPRTAEALADAGKVYGASSKAVRRGEAAGMVRGVRRSKVVMKDGSIGGQDLLAPLKENPVLRRRDLMVGRVIDDRRLRKLPIVSTSARAARRHKRTPLLGADVLREDWLAAPSRALRDLTPDEQTVWGYRLQGADIREHASSLRKTLGEADITPEEHMVASVALETITKPSVLELFDTPTPKIEKALGAGRDLGEKMGKVLVDLGILSERQLLDRRLLPQRVLAAMGNRVAEHPEVTVSASYAANAAKMAATLQRLREGKATAAEQSAMELFTRQRQVDVKKLAEAEVVRGKARKLRETPDPALMREAEGLEARADSLANDPDPAAVREAARLREQARKLRETPEPIEIRAGVATEGSVAQKRKELTTAEYRRATAQLRRWFEGYYNEVRYGRAVPTPEQVQRGAARQRSARQRKKGGRRRETTRDELERVIATRGLWSREAARAAEGGGPRLVALLREHRTRVGNRGERPGWGDTEGLRDLDSLLQSRGVHPGDAHANVGRDLEVASDVVAGWLDEELGGEQLVDVALGGARPGVVMHADEARDLMDEARRLDPDLHENPTNEEVADALAERYVITDRDAGTTPRKDFVDRAVETVLEAFENDVDPEDAANAIGGIRGNDAKLLADRLGIRDVETGYEPSVGDWRGALRGLAEKAGFDEKYRAAVQAVRGREWEHAENGIMRRPDDVPDTPHEVLVQTAKALEQRRLREARDLDRQAKRLEGMRRPREAKAVNASARRLKDKRRNAEAARLDRHADAMERAATNTERYADEIERLHTRAEKLRSTPTKLEQTYLARAQERVPMKLEGERTAGDVKYDDAELVNPETGRLFRDEAEETSIEDLRVQAEGTSYFPHRPASAKSGGATARAVGAVKREPSLASNLRNRSTGAAFEKGTYDMDPMMLLNEARGLIRTKLAHDLYRVALEEMSIPFEKGKYQATGGSSEWVVADLGKIRNLASHLDRSAALVGQLEHLLPVETFQATVRELAQKAAESDLLIAKAEAGQLVMMPRTYYTRLTGDLQDSSKAAAMWIDRPLDVFRALTLFARPAYYVNNVVGQNLILAVKEQGVGFIPSYIKFLSASGKRGAARKLFKEAVDDPTGGMALWLDAVDTWAPELKGASVYDADIRVGVESVRQRWTMGDNKAKRFIGRRVIGLSDDAARFGAMLSDDVTRQFRFIRLMMPEVRAARKAGETGEDAAIAMRILEADPRLRERMVHQVLDDLIDYRGMSHFERSVVRRVIPFYGWMRGITVWMADLGYNDPVAFMALAQIGHDGERTNAEWGESVPDYLKASVLIGGPKDGVQRSVNTQGLNPFGTVGDVAKMLAAFTGGDPRESLATNTIAGQLNPYGRALLQATFNQGKDFTTRLPMGTPWSALNAEGSEQKLRGGIPGATLLGVAGGMPQPMLYRRWKTIQDNEKQFGTPGTASSVNTSDMRDYWYSYLGLPVRDVNLAAARARRKRDDTVLAGEAY